MWACLSPTKLSATVVQNNQEPRLKHRATRTSVRSFVRTAISFPFSILLALLASSTALIHSLAHSLTPACGKVNDQCWDMRLLWTIVPLYVCLPMSVLVTEATACGQSRRTYVPRFSAKARIPCCHFVIIFTIWQLFRWVRTSISKRGCVRPFFRHIQVYFWETGFLGWIWKKNWYISNTKLCHLNNNSEPCTRADRQNASVVWDWLDASL